MIFTKILSVLCATTLLSACTTLSHADTKASSEKHYGSHNEPTPYDANSDAWADVNAAKATSRMSTKMTIVAMGANWCHDSRALAAHFKKNRFKTLLDENYTLVYVDVGQKDRNIDLAQKLGVDSIVGTPTVFILSSEGKVQNLDTAPTWRNAASRSEDEVFKYFEDYTK